VLERVGAGRGLPKEITVDNGTEFFSKAMDAWCHTRGVRLDFIRPGRPTENGYIESFNGKLRDECLNAELFLDLLDPRRKLDACECQRLGWSFRAGLPPALNRPTHL
jgi:putative transposase